MATEKTSIPLTDIIEENIFSKPKCQAILSLIAHFQHNNKNIQRAHLIQALVKNTDSSSSKKNFAKKRYVNDTNLLDKEVIDRLRKLAEIAPKIMFNSIANLDKTVQYLRKLGLITNQYLRGYPRIILTDKGRIFFYKYLIKNMADELVHDGSQLMSIPNHILTSFIPKEKRKTMYFTLSEFDNSD